MRLTTYVSIPQGHLYSVHIQIVYHMVYCCYDGDQFQLHGCCDAIHTAKRYLVGYLFIFLDSIHLDPS